MPKDDIISKLKGNNNKLEKILSKKDFLPEVKNLLLSMLYKIELSYNDYANIKRNVETKQNFIDNVLRIIEKSNYIEIIKPYSEVGKDFERQKIDFIVDKLNKRIKAFPTERALLYAILEMDNNKMYLDEEYSIIRNSLPEILNEGKDINNVEIIRDFNAWSWNTLPQEISNTDANLIYQNLQMLLGYEFLNNWMNLNKEKKMLEILRIELVKKYDENVIDNLLDKIYRISVIISAQKNEKEKIRLQEEYDYTKKELEKLEDKKNLVEEISKNKKEIIAKIKEIDTILNDEELLFNEFEKRNESLSKYKKIYSLDHLSEKLKRERKKALNDLEECQNILDAKKYIKVKSKIKDSIELLDEINKLSNKNIYMLEIQKLFLTCFRNNIRKAENKKEIMDLLYILRYYKFIPYDNEKFIKDVHELEDDINTLENLIIEKIINFKLLNKITKDKKLNINIVQFILKTRIMKFEDSYIEFEKNEENIIINLYDGDTFEQTLKIPRQEKIQLKYNKKIKIFN